MTVDAEPHGAAAGDTAPATVGWRHVLVLVTVLLGLAAVYGVGVLLPYYVNDLHRLPLAQVAGGAYDPEDLWPRGAWAGAVTAAGVAGVVFGPLVALTGIVVGSAWLAWLWRRPAAARAALSIALVVVIAGCLAALLFLLNDTGVGLKDWRLD